MATSNYPAKGASDAVAYVRASTEHQQYSTANQMDVIERYATGRGLSVIKSYSDEGKSGLTLRGRASLTELLRDASTGAFAFKHILVYDVSRWGRFQDVDESAYYEYLCRLAGLSVHYCAEPFENDGSIFSSIIKSLKRVMAAEYSRELSVKTFQGHCRGFKKGFLQGGMPGFGLRRMLVAEDRTHKMLMLTGEHKALRTDRTTLVLGPKHETDAVKYMFQQFVGKGRSERQIARSLNKRGSLNQVGRPWTRFSVHQILTNERYIGNTMYCRRSNKLKNAWITNPPEKWLRAVGVHPPIVEPALFRAAQERIAERARRATDEEMLDRLRAVLACHGRITGQLINDFEGGPGRSTYNERFGTLLHAYRLIGYQTERDFSSLEARLNLDLETVAARRMARREKKRISQRRPR